MYYCIVKKNSMNLKKLFFTKVSISYGGAKLLKNATVAFLGLYSYGFYGQVQKLDSRFDILLKNKENLANGKTIKGLESADMKLDQHLVVTSKGAQTMYSCIIYTKEPEKLKSDGFLVQSQLPTFSTALVTIQDIERLINLPYVTSVMAPTFDELHNDVSRAQSGASLLQSGAFNNTAYNGTGILVGVYDTGIDWKHPDFRKADDQTKSRIVSIWDQTLTAQGAEVSPTGFSTGVEYTRAQIEDELDGTPPGFVRENDTNGHGTHVTGTAAGNGAAFADKRHKGFSTDADIVFVKGGNGSFPVTNTINALTYFQNVATALNKPIVVNMSIGGQASAHDGTSSHEVAVDSFTSSGPGRVVVISAGNDYGANLHRKVDIEPSGAQSYVFTVGSSTSAATVFSFIMYANNDTPVTAKLTAPDGQQYVQNISTNTTHSILGGGFTAAMYNYWGTDNNKRYVQLVVNRVTGSTANCQGNYTLEITNNGAQTINAHGWLYSQGVATTLQNGDNEYIVGTPGNASSAITVASYMGRASWYAPAGGYLYTTPQESISPFSAQGPRVDNFQKPDITGSGQVVISSRSGNSAPAPTDIIANTNYYVKNQGTSMSSPGVAGAVGLLLQANPTLTAAQVKARLTSNARKDGATGNIPNTRWGYGKLDIYKAVTDELGCVKSNFEVVTYDEPYIIANTESNSAASNFDNMALAVRYTPTLTGKLGGFSFTSGSGAIPTDLAVDIQIRKVNANGDPGDIIATKTVSSWVNDVQRFTWNYVDLASLNVQMVTGKDFYIVINGLAGRVAIKNETTAVSGRSKTSTDGTSWITRTFDLKMRATVYENVAEVKNLATSNQTKTASAAAGYNYFTNACQLISRVEKETASTITGNVTSKVWVDNVQPDYVSRRYEISPAANATTATGKVTLYFKQADFDAYNQTSVIKLPTSASDNGNKANLIIEKYAGTSVTGTVASYGSPAATINPNIADIVWNETYQYWEVSFQSVGFGGYFVKTSPTLGTTEVKLNSEVNITPNPAKDFVNVMLGRHSKGTVTIYDASGKLIKTVGVNTNSNRINVSELVKGTYLFTIMLNDNTTITKKVVKE